MTQQQTLSITPHCLAVIWFISLVCWGDLTPYYRTGQGYWLKIKAMNGLFYCLLMWSRMSSWLVNSFYNVQTSFRLHSRENNGLTAQPEIEPVPHYPWSTFMIMMDTITRLSSLSSVPFPTLLYCTEGLAVSTFNISLDVKFSSSIIWSTNSRSCSESHTRELLYLLFSPRPDYSVWEHIIGFLWY